MHTQTVEWTDASLYLFCEILQDNEKNGQYSYVQQY